MNEVIAQELKDWAAEAPTATLVDRFNQYRIERLALDKQAAERKARETICGEALIARMLDRSAGMLASPTVAVKLHKSEVPTVTNWDDVYHYIVENNAWELLQKRISVTAVRDRWDDKQQVPGVEAFPAYKITINKL